MADWNLFNKIIMKCNLINYFSKVKLLFLGVLVSVFLSSFGYCERDSYDRTLLELRLWLGSENIVIAEIDGPLIKLPEDKDVWTQEYSESLKNKDSKIVWRAYQSSISKIYYTSRYSQIRHHRMSEEVLNDKAQKTVYIKQLVVPEVNYEIGGQLIQGGFVILEYDPENKGYRILSRPEMQLKKRIKKLIIERLKIEKELLKKYYSNALP